MSYQIGQIRKAGVQGNFLQSQNYNIVWGDNGIPTQGYQTVFKDFGIQIPNQGTFNPNEDYYLRFTIKRKVVKGRQMNPNILEDPATIILTLRLFKELDEDGTYLYGNYQTIESQIPFHPYIEDTNEEYTGYEIIFRPNSNGYKYLGFLLSRVYDDYNQEKRRSIYDPRIEDGINIFLNESIPNSSRSAGDLCTIKNILAQDQHNMDKIGIQTKPGTLICVNHEPIRVGRSGIYEVNNGVKIFSVGVCAPDGDEKSNINDFILDYAYTTD